MIAIVMVWSLFFAPDDPVEEPGQTTTEQVENQDTTNSNTEVAPVTETTLIAGNDSIVPDSAAVAQLNASLTKEFGAFAAAAQGNSETVIIRNNRIKAEINTKGGLFELVSLQDGYHTYWDSTDIRLWDPEISKMSLEMYVNGIGAVQSDKLFLTPSANEVVADENSTGVLRMKLPTTQSDKYLEIVYTLPHDSYEIKCDINLVGLSGVLDPANSPKLNWYAAGLHQEKGIDIERQRSSVFFRYQNMDRDYLSEAREDDEQLEEPLNWMAYKQNYFSAMVISDQGFPAGGFVSSYPPKDETDTLHTMIYDSQLNLAQSGNSIPLRFFFGPNDFKVLKDLKVAEASRIIDYGWSIFGWVNRNMIRPLFTWLSSFIGSYGLIIIILTVLIKMLLSPITWKNYLSSAKMRVLRPEIDAINKKYEGKDAMEKQQATMALYRQTGVSPFAGCLPMLLQLPILYAMFRFFPASIELRGESFLWAEDLGTYDQIFSWTTEIPLLSSIYGNHISGFTLLMAISTFFYTRMNSANMPTQSQPGMPNMKVIMNIFPFMMLIFFNKFAAGLSFYYFMSNLMSIGQMWAIKKWFINEDKIRAKIDENKKKPKKQSKLQQRLEEARKLQQEQQKKRGK